MSRRKQLISAVIKSSKIHQFNNINLSVRFCLIDHKYCNVSKPFRLLNNVQLEGVYFHEKIIFRKKLL